MSKNGITKKVKLDDITLDGGTQIREKLCQETVAEYAAAYEAGSKFPPLKVCSDGSTYWLYDGFHRWHANKKAGGSHAEVEVFQGTQRDAILLACGANPDHGLKRSNKDKRRAVERLLNDEEWVLWSDRRIAEQAAVGVDLVSDVRRQVSESDTSSPAAKAADKPRTGKDGKQYPARTGPKAIVNGRPEGPRPKVHRADADMPPFQLDETGAEVPAQLVGIFEKREVFRKAARMVRDAAGIVAQLKKETAGRHLTDEADCLEHLAGEIELSMPHSVEGRTWRCGRG